MKKILYVAFAAGALFCSCDSKGPKSRVYVDDRTSEEMLQDISDASEGDGWLHKYDTDVFYLEDGEWVCYGKVSVYANLEDEQKREWVQMDGVYLPVEDADEGGYQFKVQYRGTWYYWG